MTISDEAHERRIGGSMASADSEQKGQEQELRRRAEKSAGAMRLGDLKKLSTEESARLIHELRVHQIELEMQNDELRRAQVALEALRARYFDLYDLAPVGYMTVSEKGLILEANLRVATLFGEARGTLINQRLSQFIVPDDQDIHYRHRKQLFETGESQVCEMRMLHRAGVPFWARVETSMARDEETGTPVMRSIISDIGESRRAAEEREKLQAELNQAQKLESVGRLAGGIAHDFNNALQVILGNADMALNRVTTEVRLYANLREIRKSARRSADLVRQLLGFARKQLVSPRTLDLRDTVAGLIDTLRQLIGAHIDLAWQPAHDLWQVKIDPSQIEQIVVNLVLNARDAIVGSGSISIEAANAVLDESYCAGHLELTPGKYVMLTVSDTGTGMSREIVDHIFEPFFTTKEMGRGSGLGLATLYGIVKQNGGLINVTSSPGRGTTFEIYLPGLVEEADKPRKALAPVKSFPGSETVLIVEDEEAVLNLGKMVLEGLGYVVLTASTPSQAIRLIGEYTGDIHLVITDVVMPEMTGLELSKRLTAAKPGLKLLFMSGYTADIIGDHGVLGEQLQFLQKPFSVKQLAERVRDILGDREKMS